jgi:hypothetical protein
MCLPTTNCLYVVLFSLFSSVAYVIGNYRKEVLACYVFSPHMRLEANIGTEVKMEFELLHETNQTTNGSD